MKFRLLRKYGPRVIMVLVFLLAVLQEMGGPPGTHVSVPSAPAYLYAWAVLSIVVMTALWWMRGRDSLAGTEVVEYHAPDGLRPAEVLALVEGQVDDESFTGTIIDLVHRGYLDLETEKGLLALLEENPRMHLHVPVAMLENDIGLEPYERHMLQKMFRRGSSIDARTAGKLLGGHRKDVRKLIFTRLTERGYFRAHPLRTQAIWAVGAFMSAFITLGLLAWLFDDAQTFVTIPLIAMLAGVIAAAAFQVWVSTRDLLAPIMIGAILAFITVSSPLQGSFSLPVVVVYILTIIALQMGKLTEKGLHAAKRAKGFRRYLKDVNRHRTLWQESTEEFDEHLGYSVAFGLGSRWEDAFRKISVHRDR